MKQDCEKSTACTNGLAQQAAIVPSWTTSFFVTGLIGCALLATGGLLGGRILAEKTATSLVMPVALAWLLLTGRVIHLTLLGSLAKHKALLIGWLVLWIAGTSPLANSLTRYLETRVETYNPANEQPLDAVVVLGGCTSTGPWRAQADEAGDRIVLAAELFLAGKTKQLVTTGEASPELSNSPSSPADHAIELWTKLGIPRDAIKTSRGRNTSEEIEHVQRLVSQLAGPRIGILTSGIHLARAVRLARAANLDVVPIAADVKAANVNFSFLGVIPRAYWLNRLSQCQHELMARLINR